MRRHRAPDAVVGVEMVEVTDADGAPSPVEAPPVPEDAEPDPTRRRALRRLGIAVVAVLALTGATVTIADARRDAARREAFADLGWVMPAMTGPPAEVWRAPGGAVLAQVDGAVVTQSDGPDLTVRAVETATGRVLWERPNANEDCSPVLDEATQGAITRFVVSRPQLLMCIAYDAPGSDGTPPAEAASAPLTFVDLRTGVVQGRVTVAGQLLGHAEADGDLLLVTVRAGGSVGVVRVDPWSGRVVWDWTSGSGVRPRQPADWTWSLDEGGTVLQVEGVRTVAVSVDTGVETEPGRSARRSTWRSTLQMASGQIVATSLDVSTGVQRVSVLDAEGTPRFEVDGSPWWTPYDDGSVPDAVVIRQETMAGALMDDVSLTSVDLDTGEERWSVPDAYSWPVFLLEGTAIVATASTVGALDVEAGAWLWQHPTAGDLPYEPLTDGDVVLVPVADGGRVLAALALRTGEERWRMTLPADAVSVRLARDGTLLVTTRSELIAYR